MRIVRTRPSVASASNIRFALKSRLTFSSYEELTRLEAVLDLVKRAVNDANERLARVEQVRAFRLFPKELHQDDGELTATQKVRRRAITEAYGPLIESMYGG